MSEKRAPEIESDARIFCPKCGSVYTHFIGLCPKCGSGYTQVIEKSADCYEPLSPKSNKIEDLHKAKQDEIMAKSSNRSRSLLFGLLQSCLLEGNALESCRLAQKRNTLSFEEKYHYAIESSKEEVNKILEQHNECFKKRIIASVQD